MRLRENFEPYVDSLAAAGLSAADVQDAFSDWRVHERHIVPTLSYFLNRVGDERLSPDILISVLKDSYRKVMVSE